MKKLEIQKARFRAPSQICTSVAFIDITVHGIVVHTQDLWLSALKSHTDPYQGVYVVWLGCCYNTKAVYNLLSATNLQDLPDCAMNKKPGPLKLNSAYDMWWVFPNDRIADLLITINS